MINNGRVMALDFGIKRVGIALSDRLRITAQPYTTLERQSDEALLDQLQQIIDKEEVTQVVVGLPRRLDGSLGDMAREVKSFITQLKQKLSIPVKSWDERFSTHAAERTLLEADVSRAKRKKVIDKTSAVWILQGFLERASS